MRHTKPENFDLVFYTPSVGAFMDLVELCKDGEIERHCRDLVVQRVGCNFEDYQLTWMLDAALTHDLPKLVSSVKQFMDRKK